MVSRLGWFGIRVLGFLCRGSWAHQWLKRRLPLANAARLFSKISTPRRQLADETEPWTRKNNDEQMTRPSLELKRSSISLISICISLPAMPAGERVNYNFFFSFRFWKQSRVAEGREVRAQSDMKEPRKCSVRGEQAYNRRTPINNGSWKIKNRKTVF